MSYSPAAGLQFSIFADKVLAPDMRSDTVPYAQFNWNLQTVKYLDFMQANKWVWDIFHYLELESDRLNSIQIINF